VLQVHPLALIHLQKYRWASTPDFVTGKKLYMISDFTPPQDGDWRYGSAIMKKTTSTVEGWIAWSIELPNLCVVVTERAADMRAHIFSLQAILKLAFESLHRFDQETGCYFKQLMVIKDLELQVSRFGLDPAGLSATLTPYAVRWISGRPDTARIQPVVDAMQDAFRKMGFDNPKLYCVDQFMAYCFQSKEIIFQLPGDEHQLRSRDLDPECPTCGHDICTLNSRTPSQQFGFLVALAAWHDLMLRQFYAEL